MARLQTSATAEAQARAAVVVEGPKTSVYVNHQQVTSVSDSTYSHRKIGVEANPFVTGGHQTEVTYSNVKVWTL